MKQIQLEQQTKIFVCIRYTIYFCLTGMFAFLLRYITSIHQEKTFVEFGIIENLQLVFLGLSCLSFFIQALLCAPNRSLLLFFASLCCFASIRELDSYFENIIPFISWKFCYLFPLTALAYIVYDHKRVQKSLFSFIGTPSFSLMCTAMFIFIPVAQIIGNRAFISYAIPELEFVMLVRRFIEEATEVTAYFILFLSTIEFFMSMRHKNALKEK